MANNRLCGRLLRTTMLCGVAAAAAPPALAQDAVDDIDDTIVVTGSRLTDANIEATSPITTIEAELFDVRGTVDTIDLVNTLPQVYADQTTAFANGANGTSTLDLRALGAVRTLVLANGKRLPPGAPTQGGYPSDVNLIPAPLVERVEIVTGGASAVYGSDAVAGVANFILKRDFEGVEIDGLFGFNQSNNNTDFAQDALLAIGEDPVDGSATDNATYDISGVFGSNLADGRGNVTAYFRYARNNGLNQGDRDFARCALGEFGEETPFCLGSNQGPFPTSFVVSRETVDGTATGDPIQLVDASGAPIFDSEGEPVFSRDFSLSPDGFTVGLNNPFNFNPDNPIRRSVERFNAGFSGHYDITDNVEAYADFGFTSSNSPQVIAPSAAFGSTINRVNCDNPLLSDELIARICGTFDGTSWSRDPDGDGFGQANIRRRFVEGGPRTDDRTLTNYRVVGGFKGTAAEHWEWDVFGQFGRTDLSRLQTNQVTLTNLERALDIVDDGSGNIVCRSTTVADTDPNFDPNCVPFTTAFDPNAEVDAEALRDYVDTPTLTTGFTQQTVFGATTQADLGNYGIVSPFAQDGINLLVGAEYRREQLFRQADGTNQAGDLVGSGGAVTPTNGSTELYEFFLETAIPVIQNAPLIDEFGISGAFRRSEYSSTDLRNGIEGGNFGTNTFAAGITYSPVPDIRIRAQFQRAIRAPNVDELFQPRNTGLSSLSDPCSGADPSATAAACANTGLDPSLFGFVPEDSGQLNTRTGGNPDLTPEIADTYTVGVIVQPRQIENLTVSVDYYNIDITDAIDTIPPDFTINTCLATGSPEFCSLIQRGPDGTLTFFPRELAFIDESDQNIGGFATSGIDISVQYAYDLGSLGDLAFGYNSTYQLKNEQTPVPGQGTFDCVGFYDAGCEDPDFQYRHNMTVGYNTPWDVRFNLLWRYIGAVDRIDSIDGATGEITTFGDIGLGNLTSATLEAQNYVDIAAFWTATENVELRFGVNNVFDNDPPILPQFGPSPTANTEGNTVAGVYDAAGRFIFVGANIRF